MKSAGHRRIRCWLPVLFISSVALNLSAEVQTTRFDPPLKINAFTDVLDDHVINVLATDFNSDGEAEFRLAYGFGSMEAFFDYPTHFAKHVLQPSGATIGGPVGTVPLGSVIGSTIVSSIASNHYAWSAGFTNDYDLTLPLGDHEATVIIANLTTGFPPQPIISISTNGTLITNIFPFLPVVSGDVARKAGVMALQFLLNGETHYGYIHFDFRGPTNAPLGGAGGVILGWAYETEPDVPIKAVSLRPEKDGNDHGHRSDHDGDPGRGHFSR